MNRIVMYSGGGGSRNAGRRVKAAHGIESMKLLFTDTLIEDKDTYRYMIESAAQLYELPKPYFLMALCAEIPDIKSDADIEKRKLLLAHLAEKTMKYIPNFTWLSNGLTPWEVFKQKRWIGNSQIAQCSHVIKQELSGKHVRANYSPEDTILYFGIDWTEIHRMKSIVKNWSPYIALAPMTEAPYQDKVEMHRNDKADGIRKQRMYEQGYAHANCGGFCVRGGQGHFINLLQNNRDYYLFNEQKEIDMKEFLGRNDVSILTRIVDGQEQNLTMRQLREEWDNGLGMQIEMDDIGGCGCFAQYA